MSYLNTMKDTENILALVESIDQQRKQDAKSAVTEAAGASSDPFSIEDLNNTVDLDDQENGIESPVHYDSKDIELSDEDKAIIRRNLQDMLDEISGESISEPALEMILEEVANTSAYLSEAEEDSVSTPVEENELLKAKKNAIIEYCKQSLDLGLENGGQIPEENAENNEGTPEENSEEAASHEASETPTEEKSEEEKEKLTEDSDPSSEEAGNEEGAQGNPVETSEVPEEEEESTNEGVCAECGEHGEHGIPNVDDDEDTIKVVTADEVEPVEVVSGSGDEEIPSEALGAPEGGEATLEGLKSEIDELKELVKSLAGKNEAVFESIGLFGEYNNKFVEGGDPKANDGAQHPDFQLKATPKTSKPGYKLGELRALASAPKKVSPQTKEQAENETEVNKVNPGFTKDKRDVGKSQETIPVTSGIPKPVTPKKAPAQKAVTPQVKAAVVRESVENKAKSFLEEAKRIIREGR